MKLRHPRIRPYLLLVYLIAGLILASSCVAPPPVPTPTITSPATITITASPGVTIVPTASAGTTIVIVQPTPTATTPTTRPSPTTTISIPPPPPTTPRTTTPTIPPPTTPPATSAPPTIPTVVPTLKTLPPPAQTTPPSGIRIESALADYGPSENITRRFDWVHKNNNWWYTATLSNSVYQSYLDRPRIELKDWAVYATHPGNEWLTDGLAEVIQRDAPALGYSAYDIVECAVVFVQSIPYTTDADTKAKSDYPRFPIETVVENTGDCEDHAILLASVLHDLGYDAILLDFPTHIAVGIAGDPSIKGTYYDYRGKRFYYIETTSKGWKIGEIPQEFRGVPANIIELTPHPVYYCRWSYPSWQDYIPLTVTVENRGSAPAEGVVVHAAFDAGNNLVWNQQKSAEFTLPIDNKATVQLSLVPPRGEHTRVVVWVSENGYSVDKTFGQSWFDTNP
jgi:hypothetical protein